MNIEEKLDLLDDIQSSLMILKMNSNDDMEDRLENIIQSLDAIASEMQEEL